MSRQLDLFPMFEFRPGSFLGCRKHEQGPEALISDLSEGDPNLRSRDRSHFLSEITADAPMLFHGGWLIIRRRAFHHAGDVGVFKNQSVILAVGTRLIRKACVVKRPKEPISGAVTRENSARAVGAVSGWGQANDHEAALWISEAGDRLSPVFFICVGFALFPRDFEAVAAQSRAGFTVYWGIHQDLLLKSGRAFQGIHGFSFSLVLSGRERLAMPKPVDARAFASWLVTSALIRSEPH